MQQIQPYCATDTDTDTYRYEVSEGRGVFMIGDLWQHRLLNDTTKELGVVTVLRDMFLLLQKLLQNAIYRLLRVDNQSFPPLRYFIRVPHLGQETFVHSFSHVIRHFHQTE